MADARVEFANQKFHFSGPNALQNAEQFIQEYEISNLQRFIKVKSKGFVKPGRAHLNGRVYWESSSKDLPILFDGCPFVILGHQVRECFNGPDRHRSSKKKGRRNEPGEHTYCVKGRLKIQTTNKMDCPASIHLRSVVRFPSLQIDSNCGSAKRRIGKKLATDLGDEANELPYEHRIYVALPGLDEHRNHLVDEMGCMTHDVHPMIVSKIHALVDDGVRNVGEMKRHITAFSRENFPTVPDTSNRYHPSNKCLRNHMYAALSLSQFSTEDQENLQRHVDIWKLERPDDKFHYIPSPNAESEDADVEDFIFVHQTAWQRRLLSRYGNEICLLDATYKVCKSDVALYFLCVSTNVGYITVGCFLLPAETVHNISRGLRQLNDWNPDWKPSYFMTDYDIKEIKSIETTFPGCFTFLCDFHREQAWDRWLKTNGVGEHKAELLKMMRAICHAASEEEYRDAVTCLQQSQYWEENARLRVWFERQWLSASKRWVHYHRQAMFNVRVSTTNGLERQHYELKHTYLTQYTEGSVTSLTTTVVKKFFPDSIKRYREKNVKCLGSSRVYSTDVPPFLRNRPRIFQEHCFKRLPDATAIPESNVSVLADNTFEVVSEDTSATYVLDLGHTLPKCSCKDWLKTHLPCKHMLCVLLKVTDHGWESLSKEFTQSPLLCLDEDVLHPAVQLLDTSTPTRATPASTPTHATPASTPTHATPASTPTHATPASTPIPATPASSPTHATPASTPIPATPASSPTRATPASTPIPDLNSALIIESKCKTLASSILGLVHLVPKRSYRSIYDDLVRMHAKIKSLVPKQAGLLSRPQQRGRKPTKRLHGLLRPRKKSRKAQKKTRKHDGPGSVSQPAAAAPPVIPRPPPPDPPVEETAETDGPGSVSQPAAAAPPVIPRPPPPDPPVEETAETDGLGSVSRPAAAAPPVIPRPPPPDPPLEETAETVLRNMLASAPTDTLVLQIDKYSITDSSIHDLNSNLTDEVIDCCLHLMPSKNVCHVDTNFMTAIFDRGGNVESTDYLPQLQFHSYDAILGAMNENNNHWVLLIIVPNARRVVYINPMGELRRTIGSIKKRWHMFLVQRCNRGIEPEMEADGWEVETVPHSKQMDSISCGIYVLKFAELYLAGQCTTSMNVTQDSVKRERRKIQLQLLSLGIKEQESHARAVIPTSPSVGNKKKKDEAHRRRKRKYERKSSIYAYTMPRKKCRQYCICGKKDDGRKYWQCESCHQWMHPSCMGLHEDDEPDNYICSRCQLSQRMSTPPQFKTQGISSTQPGIFQIPQQSQQPSASSTYSSGYGNPPMFYNQNLQSPRPPSTGATGATVATPPQQVQSKSKGRKHQLAIVDPNTGKDISGEIYDPTVHTATASTEVHTRIQLQELPDEVLKQICKEVVLADGDSAYLSMSLVCSRLEQICSDPGFQLECHLSWLLSFHEESYWREPENSQYYHGFQIVKCRECNDQYKEEGDGYFGGHGRRGECNGFYTSASHPGYCGVFCARMSKFEC